MPSLQDLLNAMGETDGPQLARRQMRSPEWDARLRARDAARQANREFPYWFGAQPRGLADLINARPVENQAPQGGMVPPPWIGVRG